MIFAHTNAYNLPAAFANREDSREELRGKIERLSGSSVILVSDILGSGKTFLVQMVMGELGLEDAAPLIAGRTKASDFEGDTPKFIDEWDIKANPRRLRRTVTQMLEQKNARAPLILMGDFTLRSANFRSMIEPLGAPDEIEMEQLNPKFFHLALNNRLARATGDEFDPSQELISEEVLSALVPNWSETPANFRDVFKTLAQVTYNLPQNYEPAFIDVSAVRPWVEKNRPTIEKGPQSELFEALVVHFASEIRQGKWNETMPLSVSSLKKMITSEDVDEFQSQVIEPFARSGLLSSFGVPEISEDWKAYDRYPGPYLPGTFIRLCAALKAATI
ncbi:hypothetical protein [Roseobacter sp. A03A-229]